MILIPLLKYFGVKNKSSDFPSNEESFDFNKLFNTLFRSESFTSFNSGEIY